MSEPAPHDARAERLRWTARGLAAAVGLWFLADGIQGVWGGAGLAVLAAVVVALLAVGLLVLRRGGRER